MYQPGDVILFAGKSWISRGIEWFTDSKYSHAALYVGNGYIIEATEAGVEKNLLTFKGCSGHCVRRMPGLTSDAAKAIVAKAESLIYDNYDFLQLLTLGVYYGFRRLGITWSALVANMPNKMICSELVAVSYLVVPDKFKDQTKLVTPDTLYTTSLLQTIEEI